jgi:hypothetical protein
MQPHRTCAQTVGAETIWRIAIFAHSPKRCTPQAWGLRSGPITENVLPDKSEA